MRTVYAVLIVLAIACSSKGNDADVARTANEAMKALTAADATMPQKITAALSGVTSSLLMGTSGAADAIQRDVLPLVESYLATIERAVKAADAYVPSLNDKEIERNLETIRKRSETFRKARDRFVALEKRARDGAAADEISASLMNIGMGLSVGQ